MDTEDPLLLETEKGLTVRIGNLFLYPPEDPLGYARRRALSADIQPRTLVFVPSVGLGHGLPELLGRLPETSSILCVEIDQRVMALAAAAGLPRDPRLTIVRTESEAAVADVLAGMGTGNFRKVVSIPLSAGYRIGRDIYSRMFGALASEIRAYWQNRMTLIGMGSLFVKNLFDNLPMLAGAGDFASLSAEKPVVVCGAGPSLDRCVPLLKRLRDRYLLVSVDTALPALAACSLSPDLIVTLEAQHANLADFLPFRDPAIPVAADFIACPEVVRISHGNLYFFSSSFAPIPLFDRLERQGLLPFPIPALGSVGVAAVFVSARLTRGEIFLAGLDFSFPRGQIHARGTPSHLSMLSSSHRFRSVGQDAYASFLGRPRIRGIDKRGAPVVTDLILRSYRDQLETIVRVNAGRMADIGETGLPLGVNPIGLAEAEERLSSAAENGVKLRLRRKRRFHGDIGAFLRTEKSALSSAEAIIGKALSSPQPAGIIREGMETLRSVDYSYVHFPDFPPRDFPSEKSFLARALVSVRYYAERINRALA
jgi:hypothetical protein